MDVIEHSDAARGLYVTVASSWLHRCVREETCSRCVSEELSNDLKRVYLEGKVRAHAVHDAYVERHSMSPGEERLRV